MKAADVTKIRTDYIASREVYEKAKRKRRRGLFRRLIAFAIILALAGGGLMSMITSQSKKMDKVEATKHQLESKLTDAKDKQQSLKRESKLLHSKEYIGKIARRDYYMSKKGEILFASQNTDKH